jgi:hypothetical protein
MFAGMHLDKDCFFVDSVTKLKLIKDLFELGAQN